MKDKKSAIMFILLAAFFIIFMWALQACEKADEIKVQIFQLGDGYAVRIVDKDNNDLKCFYCAKPATSYQNLNGVAYCYCEKHKYRDDSCLD